MDKDRDFEIYAEINSMLAFEFETYPIHQGKVLHSRILKISSAQSKYSYASLGIALSRSGQTQKSILLLKKFINIDPHNTGVQIELANALLKLGKVNECLDSIKKALSFSPQTGPLHRILIETLEKNKKLEQLESCLKEIAETIIDPTSRQEFYVVNAEVLTGCKKYSQALVSYKSALEIAPVTEHLYHYNYGLILFHQGLFEEAIVQFEHAWNLNPTGNAFNNIVHLNYCVGQFEKALEGYEEIFQSGLEVHYTYSNYLLVLYHLDEDEEIINKYKELLRPFIDSHRNTLLRIYQEELRITRAILQKEGIDEKTKEFNQKKVKGIESLFSFFAEF